MAFNQVDSAFFNAFGIPLLAGRGFEPGDPQGSAIVVNRSFVNRVLAGGNPLGRVVRVPNRNGPVAAYEIVGLVGDQFSQSDQPTMYRPLAPVAAVPEPGACALCALRDAHTVPHSFRPREPASRDRRRARPGIACRRHSDT